MLIPSCWQWASASVTVLLPSPHCWSQRGPEWRILTCDEPYPDTRMFREALTLFPELEKLGLQEYEIFYSQNSCSWYCNLLEYSRKRALLNIKLSHFGPVFEHSLPKSRSDYFPASCTVHSTFLWPHITVHRDSLWFCPVLSASFYQGFTW